MPCWHLYLIRTMEGSLYTGITTDVQRRYREHLDQGGKAAHYLRAHKPLCLAFSQIIGDRSLALKVERRFKRLSKKIKERIAASGRLDFDRLSGEILFPDQDRA
ncbi:MAG TPA: GIY-YIG nuclease family protein [Deltaproteobacteria bacterium]|nr:GIY-YIG nuclease family protein [Deltaproteobacteria bacterium]